MTRPERRTRERRPDDVAPLGGLEALLLLSMPPARTMLDPERAAARAARWMAAGAQIIAEHGAEACQDPIDRYGWPLGASPATERAGQTRTARTARLTRRATAQAANAAPGPPRSALRPSGDVLDDLDDDEDDPLWRRALSPAGGNEMEGEDHG